MLSCVIDVYGDSQTPYHECNNTCVRKVSTHCMPPRDLYANILNMHDSYITETYDSNYAEKLVCKSLGLYQQLHPVVTPGTTCDFRGYQPIRLFSVGSTTKIARDSMQYTLHYSRDHLDL